MTETSKAEFLMQESNRLHDALNTYNNVIVPQVNGLMASHGFTSPVAISDVQAMEFKNRAGLMAELLLLCRPVALEAAYRSFENNYRAKGYATLADVIADTPNHFTQGIADVINNTFTRTAETLAVTDALIDPYIVHQLLEIVTTAAAKVEEVTPTLHRI